MSDENRVKQNQLNRFSVLKLLYDDANGNPEEYIDINEFEKKFNFDSKTYHGIIEYLRQESLISFPAGSYMNITNWGIKEIEAAVSSPESPTEHFPAKSNFIYVEHMENSIIQQDSPNSSSQILNITETQQLSELLPKINVILDHNELTPIQKNDINQELDTINAQSKTSKPKKTIIAESLKSILGIISKIPAIVSAHPEIIEAIKLFLHSIGFG